LYIVKDVSENFIETNLTTFQGHNDQGRNIMFVGDISKYSNNLIFKTTELSKFDYKIII